MILTVTLNPAIDKTCDIDTLIPGQVNRIIDNNQYAGGKGINVTKVLAQFGEEVTALGFLGGYTGRFIEEDVKKSGAKVAFTTISGPTRTNMNILGADGYVTEILEPGPVITKEETVNFIETYKEEVKNAEIVVLSGSLPKGLDDGIYGKLIDIANDNGKKVILDTSRIPLRESIKHKPYMIKPNIKEMEFLSGKKLSSMDKILEEAKRYHDMGIEYVVVSMGKRGLIHVDGHMSFWVVPPAVEVVNTVSCGDALVASYARGLLKGMSSFDIAKFGGAVSASKATVKESGKVDIELATALLDKVEVREL